MKGFYRYIYYSRNRFRIIKDNEDFIWFDNIYDALAHRDALEDCDWMWDCYLNVEVDEEKYVDVKLPPFSHHDLKYIFNETGNCRGKKPFVIKKSIDGKLRRFGRYRTVDEAIQMRDTLIDEGWCSISELKKRKREKT